MYRTPILVSDRKCYIVLNACKQNEFLIEARCKAGARSSELDDIIQERKHKVINVIKKIISHLYAGTCWLTAQKGYCLEHRDNETILQSTEQYKQKSSPTTTNTKVTTNQIHTNWMLFR